MVLQQIAQRVVPPRRSFLTSLASLIAAPAVVRAAALMPVKVWEPTFFLKRAVWYPALFYCMSDDLIGVDLASLGLEPPITHAPFRDSWGVRSDQTCWMLPRTVHHQMPLQLRRLLEPELIDRNVDRSVEPIVDGLASPVFDGRMA